MYASGCKRYAQQIAKLVEDGVNTSRLPDELVPVAKLQGLEKIVSRCTFFVDHTLFLFENSLKSVCETLETHPGQFPTEESTIVEMRKVVEGFATEVNILHVQLLEKISQLKESIVQEEIAAKLA